MNGARLGVGAQSVGVSEAAYQEAVNYANDRKQFGKAIIEFPAVYEMLSLMKAKLDASRALLYETCRYVDLYKAYEGIEQERKLTPEERAEYKEYSRLADAFTPLVKMFASEYANQNAYDSIQVHGGSGFMKDYACERIYRDARILTIYEGTTQLQVVAAIRYVTTGAYLKKIRDYEQLPIKPEFQNLRKRLLSMATLLETAVARVDELKNQDYLDFQARRLVEMAANIVMGYLLLHDAQRDAAYSSSAGLFIEFAVSENKVKSEFIGSFQEKTLGLYKVS